MSVVSDGIGGCLAARQIRYPASPTSTAPATTASAPRPTESANRPGWRPRQPDQPHSTRVAGASAEWRGDGPGWPGRSPGALRHPAGRLSQAPPPGQGQRPGRPAAAAPGRPGWPGSGSWVSGMVLDPRSRLERGRDPGGGGLVQVDGGLVQDEQGGVAQQGPASPSRWRCPADSPCPPAPTTVS